MPRAERREPTAWRTLVTPPLPGPENMALDEGLLARARRTGESVFRVYTWSEPTLSLGRHQRATGVYDPARARDLGVGIVRRITGGRALLHHREVTYSVTAPAFDGGSMRASYAAINELLLHALQALGVPATLAGPQGRTPPPASAPCFERPAAGEILLGGRKLVGSAQVREDGALLQHGSILVHDDQALIAQLAVRPVGSAVPAATLEEALGRTPGPDEVAGALFAAIRQLVTGGAAPLRLDDDVLADQRIALERYRSDGWTWRR